MFAATIAHTLDVDGMLDSVDRKQFNEWVAFWNIQPWYVGFPLEKQQPKSLGESLDDIRRQIGV